MQFSSVRMYVDIKVNDPMISRRRIRTGICVIIPRDAAYTLLSVAHAQQCLGRGAGRHPAHRRASPQTPFIIAKFSAAVKVAERGRFGSARRGQERPALRGRGLSQTSQAGQIDVASGGLGKTAAPVNDSAGTCQWSASICFTSIVPKR